MIRTRLSDLAGHVSADWRDALGLDGEAPPDPATPVLWHQGDLALPQLALDDLAALAPGGDDAPWLLYVQGDLRLEGALLASEYGGNAHLLVGGALHARHALLGPGLVAVAGALRLQELLWGDGTSGRLQVGGAIAARWALFSGGYAARWHGPAELPWLLDAAAEAPAPGADPTGYLAEALAAQLCPEGVDSLSDGQGGPGSLFERDVLCARARAGEALLQEPGVVPGLLQRAHAIGGTPDIGSIRALVQGPLIARRAHRLQDWFGNIDYALCRRHVDADGDQREDSVFITVWRRWDFYFQAGQVERPRGLLGWVAARLGLRDAPLEDELSLLWRRYDDSGACSEWSALDGAAPAEARAAATAAWQAVLAHAGEGLAQAEAGHPLWGWLQRGLTPGRLQALARLPVFTDEYNDWWDSDRNGFWERDVWVGVRQAVRRGGHAYSLALKLSWETGPSAAGDDEDNNHASYMLELEGGHEGEPWLRFTEAQRQDHGRTPLLHHSAAHLLRLARMFGAVERRLLEREAQRRAEHAEAERARALARLLVRPPVSDALPDAEVFPPELLALSEQWQQQGRDYVAAVRRYQLHHDAQDSTDTEPPLPEADPRKADAATALQLARVVHRCHDPGLSRRLREHFAYAPDALLPRSREAGQCVSAVFLLDAERLLARIGEPWRDDHHWLLLNGLRHSALPRLQGAGRSLDGHCWALCEDGALSTRRTLEGPAIAHFPLPRGDEQLPALLGLHGESPLAQRCDQLIPFSDGQRVLLRNPTGIYLLHPGRVQRLHPQVFDEDGPYTWPKNQEGNGLGLDMLHMALSPDERWIALGDQDSVHLLLSADDGQVRHQLEPQSSYPHHAAFHGGGAWLLANACHLYNGVTGAWELATLANASGDAPEPAHSLQPWRIYASAPLPGGITVVGDADGYLHAIGPQRQTLWRHHVGGTIASVDASPDGSTLVAGSYGGYLVGLQRGDAGMDPFSIGTSPYEERWRWIFWDGEDGPLRW